MKFQKWIAAVAVAVLVMAMLPVAFAAGNTVATLWAGEVTTGGNWWDFVVDISVSGTALKENGYLSVYCSTDAGVNVVLSGGTKDWAQVFNAAEACEGGFVTVFSYDALVSAYGGALSDVNKVSVYVSTGDSVTVTKVTYTAPEETPEETTEPEETTVPEETTEPEETTAPEETTEPEETTTPEENTDPEETTKPSGNVAPAGYNAFLCFSDGDWWPGVSMDSDYKVFTPVSGPGSYTLSWNLSDWGWEAANGAMVFYIDIDDAFIKLHNCGVTALTVSADGAPVNVNLSNVKVYNSNGDYRIELYNAYSGSAGAVSNTIQFSENLTVSFTLEELAADSPSTGDGTDLTGLYGIMLAATLGVVALVPAGRKFFA